MSDSLFLPYQFNLKNDKPAIIREATADDAAQLIAYMNIVGGQSDFLTLGQGEFDLNESEEAEFLTKCQNADNQIYLVAIVESDIAGTLHFATGRRMRVRHSGEFGMSVNKSYWRQGIGASLLKVLIMWAKHTRFVKKINLRVRSDNERVISLYESIGFQQEGLLTNEMFVRDKYYDLVAMGLNLSSPQT